MRPCSRSPRQRFAFGLLLAGCRTAAPAAPVDDPASAAKPPSDDALANLPGFRAATVNAPVFGGQVYVMEAGNAAAPAVVLVHGLGENGCRDFRPVLPALAAQYRVVAFDLPGFGRSTHASELYSPARYAEFMRRLLGERLSGPFNLVGHSMGGALALLYAARFPADVERLLLLDVAGVLHRKAFVSFAVFAGLDNLLGVLAKPVKDIATVAEESTEAALPPGLPGLPDPAIVLHNDVLRQTVLGSPTRIAALATILENFAPAIDGVRAPSWILWGSNDAIASPRTGLILQARLPAARLVVLDGSGHDPMLSRPAAVTQFLLDALATPAAPRAARAEAASFALPARQGRCEKQDGMSFSGDYAALDIVGCREVVLRDVRAGALRIRDSYAVVENTRVVSPDVALEVKGSRVEITASDFAGEVGLRVEGSDLDLAGVELRGKRAALHVGGFSKLIFSVSRATSPITQRYLHGVHEFESGVEL
ncbi:MAG: alpha/beta hydrolase [Deltaproteobacteria bacterium]|nr:alpha/beta hydrolase [Deltaproteobacteria bacterium]